MARYFKRPWDETRGDQHDAWGTSEWFFEVGDDAYPLRQLELYENGTVLKYDKSHLHDEFGALGDQPLELDEFASYEISESAFREAWAGHEARNR